MKTVCVFCGSSTGGNSKYINAARELGTYLAENELALVYGAGNVGLMGQVAQSALAGGGKVIGVIPEFLVKKEVVYREITDLRIVGSMHERKALMAELSDGFVAMPGGFGTLEETVEVLTWGQLGLHKKPIGLLNIEGYYNRLNEFFAHMVAEEFLRDAHRKMIMIDDNPADLISAMQNFSPPKVKKWINLNKV